MARSHSGTLTPSTVAPVTVGPVSSSSTGFGADVETVTGGIEVVNRSLTGEIWVRLDGVDPVVGADDCFVVLGARRFDNPTVGGSVTVKLISTAALTYSVEATPGWTPA